MRRRSFDGLRTHWPSPARPRTHPDRGDVTAQSDRRFSVDVPRPGPAALDEVIARFRGARLVHLLLDYDGTLVPIAPTPEAASPDGPLKVLLRELAGAGRFDVHIVSGRTRTDLGRWFGDLAISLWAEHALWHRPAGDRQWVPACAPGRAWRSEVLALFERVTPATPGERIERKSASLAWHYRLAPRELASRRVRELTAGLTAASARWGLDVLEGAKVLEVRRAGAGKARVARWLAQSRTREQPILAIGDDRTDEELFAALPQHSITVSVGRRLKHARYHLASPRQVRRALARLLDVIEGRRRPSTHLG
jgi:trehalose 6-phosphate synthase/phosphatase